MKPRYLFPEAMGCPPLGLDDRCRNTNAPHDSTQSYENAASEIRYGLPPVGLGRSLTRMPLTTPLSPMRMRPAKPAMGCPPLGLDDRCRNNNFTRSQCTV